MRLKDFRYWERGLLVGLGLGILFNFYKLSRAFYKDWVFSSMRQDGFVFLYNLPDLGMGFLMLLFFVSICTGIGLLFEFYHIRRFK